MPRNIIELPSLQDYLMYVVQQINDLSATLVSSPQPSDWDPSSTCPMGNGGSIPGGKAEWA
jgi:hypothetical protein